MLLLWLVRVTTFADDDPLPPCPLAVRAAQQTISTLTGHSKKVTGVLLHPTVDAVVSSSMDATVRLWSNQGGSYTSTFTLKPHSDGVVGVALHPCADYIVSASVDKSWAFSNIAVGRVLATVADPGVAAPFSSLQVHPDGILMATGGDDGVVRVWNVKDVRAAPRVPCGGAIDVTLLATTLFSRGTGAGGGGGGACPLWFFRTPQRSRLAASVPLYCQHLSVRLFLSSVFPFDCCRDCRAKRTLPASRTTSSA